LRDDEAADFADFVFEISDIGNSLINPRNSFVGETHATVDDKNIVSRLIYIHVIVDVGHAPQGDNADGVVVRHRFLS
jgi:hypothetical protein